MNNPTSHIPHHTSKNQIMNSSILNTNYDLLPGSYLFSTIAQKIKEYQAKKPDADIIRLGIGDVTKPLVRRPLSL